MKRGAKFATWDAKWNVDSEGYKAPELFPEDIPEATYKRIQTAAIDACKALRIQDYGRVDMRVRPKRGGKDDEWEMFIIEVNPNPYLERTAEVAKAAQRKQLEYADLVEKILELAMHRNRMHEPGPSFTPTAVKGA